MPRHVGWSDQTPVIIMSDGPLGTKRYRHFSYCCSMPIRICSLIATTIYPDHSVGDRSGLRRSKIPSSGGETSASIPPKLVSTDYYALQASLCKLRPGRLLTSLARHSLKDDGGCHAIVSPYGSLSPLMETRQIMPVLRSRRREVNTHLSAHERRVYLPGLRWIEDFILCCGFICLWHDSSHQARLTRFLYIAPRVAA